MITNSRFYAVIVTLALFLILKFKYDFKSPSKNLILIVVYYVVALLELMFITFSFPESGGPKGIFFDVIATIVPFAYLGLRWLSGIMLFIIYYRSKKLDAVL